MLITKHAVSNSDKTKLSWNLTSILARLKIFLMGKLTNWAWVIIPMPDPPRWFPLLILLRAPYISSQLMVLGHQQTYYTGPWFNINISYQYRKSHCGDKTVLGQWIMGLALEGIRNGNHHEQEVKYIYIFIIKMSSYQYRKSHCGYKTVVWPAYIHNGIFYTGKKAYLYWISPLINT